MIETIEELVAAIELVGLVVHEDRARLVTWPEGEAPTEARTKMTMGIRRSEDAELCFRFKVTVADERAELVADIEAIYAVEGQDEVAEPVTIDFAGKVAFMTVYPYLRMSLFAGANRIGTPAPVLGIVRQGQFEAGANMSQDDVRQEFFDTISDLASD